MGLQEYIETAIAKTRLSRREREHLQGIYQYVRANDPLRSPEDFDRLTQIDAIVQNSNLPLSLKQRYALSSAQTRAFTADEAILNLIATRAYTGKTEAQKDVYRNAYNRVRLGQPVEDEYTLGSLDALIRLSDISPEVKTIYILARDRFFEGNNTTILANLGSLVERGGEVFNGGSAVVAVATQIFSVVGLQAGTGTAISSLAGGAATNATLAAIGGGSVAAGGLGMLECFLAPSIPLDRLTNALNAYMLSANEKLLGIIEIASQKGFFGLNVKSVAVAFSDRGIWWQDSDRVRFAEYTSPDYLFEIAHLPKNGDETEERKIYDLALKLQLPLT